MSNFQQNISRPVTHTKGKKANIEMISEWAQMLDLADKDFSIVFINSSRTKGSNF